MGWLDVSQVINDFQIQPNQIIYLVSGEVKRINENYTTVYSDERLTKIGDLRKE
ncbi:MAG: hypothetical protein ACKO96_14330 [Flammeovirgaceae bacterium]